MQVFEVDFEHLFKGKVYLVIPIVLCSLLQFDQCKVRMDEIHYAKSQNIIAGIYIPGDEQITVWESLLKI